MGEAQVIEVDIQAPSEERLSWEEICRRHPDEWVMLIETDWIDQDNLAFNTTLVLDHHRDFRLVLRRTKDYLDANNLASAFLFTGPEVPASPVLLSPLFR